MIKINVNKKDGKLISISVKGHANSDVIGKDLVCAAVSAVTFGGLNAIKEPNKLNIKVSDGDVNVTILEGLNDHDYDVFDVMVTQYKTIEKKNKQYINIVEKGL